VAKHFLRGNGVSSKICSKNGFVPGTKITSLWEHVSLAVQEGSDADQLDVKTTVLNGELEEEVYMMCPIGFEVFRRMCGGSEKHVMVCDNLYRPGSSRGWNMKAKS
jgi:hypothetical protein